MLEKKKHAGARKKQNILIRYKRIQQKKIKFRRIQRPIFRKDQSSVTRETEQLY